MTDNPHLTTLGIRLRWLRRQRGWTQEHLGRLTDTSQAVVQKIENGKSLSPRCLPRIAEALSTTRGWLMYGEGFAGNENDTRYRWLREHVGGLLLRNGAEDIGAVGARVNEQVAPERVDAVIDRAMLLAPND